MPSLPVLRWLVPAAAMAAALLASCAPSRPLAIRVGSECAACGMPIEDLRFACERGHGGDWSQYDSIECLLRDRAAGAAWLADYDSRQLAPAESLWTVEGDFPSPMGGGLAAFRDHAVADQVASQTRGRVGRFGELASRQGGSR